MKRTTLAIAFALASAGANADPVKCVDANGKVRYVDSSTPGTEKCTPVTANTQVVPSQGSRYSPPPSTSGGTPRGGEGQVRTAQSELDAAKRALAEQEAIRTGDEKNYQRVLDRLKPYQEAVERAQQNLDKAQRDAR